MTMSLRQIEGASASKNQEVDEPNLAPDILDKIFHKLNARDLCRAAAVNKLWNAAAKREMDQRGLEIAEIPLVDEEIYEVIRTKPYVAIMFLTLGVKLSEVDLLPIVNYHALTQYQNCFPKYLVIVGMNQPSMHEEFAIRDENMPENGIISLLIPEFRDLKIRAAYVHRGDNFPDQELLNQFLPEDTQSTATFIVFARSYYPVGRLFELLNRRMKRRRQKFTVWGGTFGNGPTIAVDCQINYPEDESLDFDLASLRRAQSACTQEIFVMSITCSSLDSWSILISLDTEEGEFEQQLIAFRGQLQLRRRNIGLTCGSIVPNQADFQSRYNIFSEKLDAVKEIFPEIPFTMIHDEDFVNRFFGMKYENEDSQGPSESKSSLALLILTYD